jgi:hypothetical protein
MLETAADIRRHIEFKSGESMTFAGYAERIRAALDAGAEPDYPMLLRAAMFPEPPTVVFHTAAPAARDSILREGLRTSDPGQSEHWKVTAPDCIAIQARQPHGIYVAAEPDELGVWAHWPAWDVWRIELGALPWQHDELNPGCWVITAPVPPVQATLYQHRGGDKP